LISACGGENCRSLRRSSPWSPRDPLGAPLSQALLRLRFRSGCTLDVLADEFPTAFPPAHGVKRSGVFAEYHRRRRGNRAIHSFVAARRVVRGNFGRMRI
jgi:hypothetical protein